METTNNGDKLQKFIYEKFVDDKITNSDLVQIIILCWDLLGLKTIQQYRKMYSELPTHSKADGLGFGLSR